MSGANSSSRIEPDCWSAAPMIVVGDSERAIERASRTLALGGQRLAGAVSIDQAIDRLDRQVSLGALWIELERDRGAALDGLLDWVERAAQDQGLSTIVAARSEMVDPLYARLSDERITILLDGSEMDRLAALALSTAGTRRDDRLSDVAADGQAHRLRQLSDEVGRIAATLAKLSSGADFPAAPAGQPAASNDRDPPAIPLDRVRAAIRARRLRSRFFDEALFADPAWDMLLDLAQAEITQVRVPVSSLCIAAAVPATTALRWIKTMTDAGLFLRRDDPHDGRRVFIELAPEASRGMRRYFAEVG